MSEDTVQSSQKQSKPWEFKPGESGNPEGRSKGSVGGRQLSLMTLDKIVGKVKNQTRLAVELQKSFDSNPLTFMKTFIMPLLPKQTELSGKDGKDLMPLKLIFPNHDKLK